MNEDYLALLEKELSGLEGAAEALRYSFEKCRGIGDKQFYTQDELESFESLTSRFARLCDILVQKTFRLIDEIDLEPRGTVRDRINRAEKKGLIKSAEEMVRCRVLRNDIAHEYTPEELMEIFRKVLEMAPILFDSVGRVKQYCKKWE